MNLHLSMRTVVFALALTPAAAFSCWDQAAQRYGVSAALLYAVAKTESNLNPLAMNLSHKERTGTYDIGLMQINSGHLPRLARYGITERDLFDACTNIQVGAWLLADVIRRHGNSWEAVGAYNAACTQLRGPACAEARARYAWRVYKRLPVSPGAPALVQAPAARKTVAQAPNYILSARVGS